MRKRQEILTGVLCSFVVVAASYRIIQLPNELPPPYKIIKLTQRPVYPVLPKAILERTVGIEFDKKLIGAGVIVKTGLILTAAHVMAGPIDRYTVRLKNKDGIVLASECTLVKIDLELDLALLACFTEVFKPVRIGCAGTPVGTPVVATGSPAGYESKLFSNLGFISRKEDKFWICSVSIIGGFSGGGLWDVNTGALLGLVQAQGVIWSACGFPIPVPGTSVVAPVPNLEEFLR